MFERLGHPQIHETQDKTHNKTRKCYRSCLTDQNILRKRDREDGINNYWRSMISRLRFQRENKDKKNMTVEW